MIARWLRITPRRWRTSVEVLSGAGRDLNGVRRPETVSVLRDVLVAPGSSTEPLAESTSPGTVTEDTASLYTPPGTVVRATDRVRVPDSHPLAGTWQVVGAASPWPKGVVVALRRIA